MSQITFAPDLATFVATRAETPLTVFCGPNNTGKSLVLKNIRRQLGPTSYLIGTNRFYHVYHFAAGLRDPNELVNFETQFEQMFYQEQTNHEQNFFDLQRVIVGLSDVDRARLLSLCGSLLGNELSMRRVQADNDLSPRYIDMDGQNVSVGSTGVRLLLTILGICMDTRFNAILIDEPELGLGPRVQQAVSTFFQDPVARKEYFPHLNQVFLATHSHLFLARSDIRSNYVTEKDGDVVSLDQVTDISEFHRLQFNLLGNSLDALFLPSAIVIVEGKTDHGYLERCLQLRFPGRLITVVPSQGDPKRVVFGLAHALGGIQKSPLRTRTFVVLDSVHQPGLKADLVRLGVPDENVIVWARNGIEHLYPTEVLGAVFSCSPRDAGYMTLEGDHVALNGITKTKSELMRNVLAALTRDTLLPDELMSGLIDRVAAAID